MNRLLQHWQHWGLRRWVAWGLIGCLLMIGVRTQTAYSKSSRISTTNTFNEVAEAAGIQWSGQNGNDAFSVAWVDFNSDGLSDLWVSPHGYRTNPISRRPRLYLNQGGGSFRNITDAVWPAGLEFDTHGSAWADFDNDGDPDLLVAVGSELGLGTGGNLLLLNSGGKLILQNNARGLRYELGRGRSPLWFDENEDGLLDVFLFTSKRPDGQAPPAVFRQNASGQFNEVTAAVGVNLNRPARSAQLVDLTGDGKLDISVQGTYAYPLKTYDPTPSTFKVLTGIVPLLQDYPAVDTKDFEETKAPRDAAIADFNGDQHADIFLPRALATRTQASLFIASDRRSAEAFFVLNAKGEQGITFKTKGNFSVDFLDRNPPTPDQIFIGASGKHPTESFFDLSASDPDNIGLASHTPGVDTGVYIGYSPSTQTWKAVYSSSRANQRGLLIRSQSSVSNVQTLGFTSPPLRKSALSPKLLVYDPATKRYVDRTVAAGLNAPILGQYAVAGDFDNDMDIDLFVSCSHAMGDVRDVFYRNRGDGTFTADASAIGPPNGAVSPHFTDFSLGPKVATADYNNDGFLDIFTTNTVYTATQKTYQGTPPQLWRNTGNANHWLEVTLRGTKSNRDGIGAQILATTGSKTQLREQGGGMHQYAQNQQRVHFGLGDRTKVDRLEIHWPSGTVQVLNNVGADQVLKVVEPTAKSTPK